LTITLAIPRLREAERWEFSDREPTAPRRSIPGSYGLATLCKKHVTLGPGHAVTFDYPAKSGKRRVQTIVDEAVFGVVAALKRRRTGGPELFAYRRRGALHGVIEEAVLALLDDAPEPMPQAA
jgi:hypothetical protein